MKHYLSFKAFTILEILVAICILIIVATIVLPVIFLLQGEAQTTVATQIQNELNKTYASWKDSGGQVNSNATTSDILSVLGSAPSTSMRSSPNGAVSDGGTSNMVSVSLPPGTPDLTQSSYQSSQIVMSANYAIVSGGASANGTLDAQFSVIPLSVLQSNAYTGSLSGTYSWNGPKTGTISIPGAFAINGQTFSALAVPIPALGSETKGSAQAYANGTFYPFSYTCTRNSAYSILTIKFNQ
jgi:type II secretory pathway pseudopilin PulG